MLLQSTLKQNIPRHNKRTWKIDTTMSSSQYPHLTALRSLCLLFVVMNGLHHHQIDKDQFKGLLKKCLEKAYDVSGAKAEAEVVTTSY